jgi:hypothetical protein
MDREAESTEEPGIEIEESGTLGRRVGYQELINRTKDQRGSFSWAKQKDTPLGQDLLELGTELYRDGHQTYSNWRLELKRILKDVWDKIKLAAYHIYKSAKTIVANERGAITPKGPIKYEKETPTSKVKIEVKEKKFSDYQDDAVDFLSNLFKKNPDLWAKQKHDTKLVSRFFSIPSHYFQKGAPGEKTQKGEIPALKRLFQAGLKRNDQKHVEVENLLNSVDGVNYVTIVDSFRKSRKVEAKRFNKYIFEGDLYAKGFKIRRKPDRLEIIGPDGKKWGEKKTDAEAEKEILRLEGEMLKRNGFSDEAVKAVQAQRLMSLNIYHQFRKNMEQLIQSYEIKGQKLPEIVDRVGKEEVRVNIKVALAQMGDRRFYWMPRKRDPGQFMITGRKEGTNPLMEFRDLGKTAELLARKWKRQGYDVKIKRARRMPEVVFEIAGKTMAMEAFMNEAMKKIGQKKAVTLAEFGLTGEWVSYKDQKIFKIMGSYDTDMKHAFETLGGRWFALKEGQTKAWHFIQAPGDIEHRIVDRINKVRGVTPDAELLFARSMVEELANIVKARGARTHMLKRSDATGKDVWLGYEEDPLIAILKSAFGVGGAEAKRQMVMEMTNIIMGTDVSWQVWRTQQIEEGIEKPVYKDYLKFVEARKIDPAVQKHAYEDATKYFQDMARNDESVDRLLGTLRGLGVTWYLAGRVSAPLVNLTALATSVPAAMKGYANIPLRRTPKYLARGFNGYKTYRWGNQDTLKKWDRRALDHIHKKGWHRPQYNSEAIALLKGTVGAGHDKAIEILMVGFSETERLNRVATILGSYIGIKAQHKGEWTENDHKLAIDKARFVSDRAHAVYGKVNWPHLLRGKNLASYIGQLFYVFKTFSHTYMLTMKDLGFNRKQRAAALYMAVSPAILAGVGASVLTPIINMILKAFGFDDPEETLYNWLEDNYSEFVSNLARFGLFGAGGYGVSLKGSLSIGITDLPTSLADIVGAPGQLFIDIYRGGKSIFKGDVAKGIENMLPLFLKAPVKAVREYTEGLTTKTNAPIYYGTKRAKANELETILRFLSFNPAGIAKIREQRWRESQVERRYTQRRQDIYSKLKKYFLQDPEDKSRQDYLDILLEIHEYNQRIIRKGLVGIVPLITKESIETNIKRSFRPQKKEVIKRIKKK